MFRAITLVFKVTLALLVAVTSAGCWDQVEVENLNIVQAIAIDKSSEGGGGGVRVLVQTINPAAHVTGGGASGMGGGSGGGGGQESLRNLSAEGETLFEAFRNLSHLSSARLFYAHTQIIAVSEDLAREKDIMEILDIFDRAVEVRRQAWLLVSRAGINEVFSTRPLRQLTTAQRLTGIIENERVRNSQYAVSRLGDFLRLLQTEGAEPYTAGIVRVPSKAMPQGMEPLGLVENEVEVRQTAVFKQGRLAGWLDDREGRGLLWVRGEVHGGAINVPCPHGGGKNLSLEIIRSRSRVKPEIDGDRVRLKVAVRLEANIMEAGRPLELGKPGTLRQVEEKLNESISGEVRAALDKAQKDLNTDVFGFGSAVHRADPGYWRQVRGQWDDIFPALEVEVEVDSTVRRTGLVVNPVELPR